MLIALSVMSGRREAMRRHWELAEMMRTWPLATRSFKAGYRVLGDNPHDIGPAFTHAEYGGWLVIIDVETGDEVWRSSWGNYLAMPSGFCFDGNHLFCADLEGCNIFEIDMLDSPGTLLRRISHPALNDVHSISLTRRGLMIASTGTDLVIELDENGNSLYEWWAADHGYSQSINGEERTLDRQAEHRDQHYHTGRHATHLNAAVYRDPEETRLLVSFWQQGAIAEIDVHGDGAPRIVLDGLRHPHTIRRLDGGGWMTCNTAGAELVLLDKDLYVQRRIPSIEGWIQDAMPLGGDRWLIADVDHERLLVQDGQGKPLSEIPVDPQWRLYGLQPVPDGVGLALSARG